MMKIVGNMSKPKNDLTGKKFNRLTVVCWVNKTDTTKEGRWKCKCNCGNIIYVRTNALVSGRTKSCGCYHAEENKKRKKYNKYNLSGKYGIGYTVNHNIPFKFDLEDYDKIKARTWSYHNGYIRSNTMNDDILLHRFVLDIKDKNVEVDHIGHDTTDNRKQSLRIANKRNHQNCILASNNKSGVTGVCKCKNSNKWSAYIWYENKNHWLGSFDRFEDAVKTRKEAEQKYFGEYSYDNSIKKYKEITNEDI